MKCFLIPCDFNKILLLNKISGFISFEEITYLHYDIVAANHAVFKINKIRKL